MLFIFGIIVLIFVIGLIVSKGSIRSVFLAGLRFLFIVFVVIAAGIWIFSIADTASKNKKEENSYNNSAYIIAQKKKAEEKKKKAEAEKVGLEFLAMIRTMFYDETCYRAWYEPFSLIEEIYKKYEVDFEWSNISSMELMFLIDEGFAEIGSDEVVIFHKVKVWIGDKRTPSWEPVIPIRRNETVRKTTVPLSQYYYGPQPVKEGYKRSGYVATVPLKKLSLIEARKRFDYRRKLEGEELKKYTALSNAYDKYEADGLYK